MQGDVFRGPQTTSASSFSGRILCEIEILGGLYEMHQKTLEKESWLVNEAGFELMVNEYFQQSG